MLIGCVSISFCRIRGQSLHACLRVMPVCLVRGAGVCAVALQRCWSVQVASNGLVEVPCDPSHTPLTVCPRPQIFGSPDIKQAIACLLFGGSRKVRTTAQETDCKQLSC